MYKKYIYIISSFIIFCSSCSNENAILFDEDIKHLKELMEWSVNHNTDNIVTENYIPVSSETLSEMVSLDEYIDTIEHNKGIIIGVLYFNENESLLNSYQKDMLILISKAQKFEDFNILIESNNIKSIMPDIIGEIVESLLSNNVKSNYISLNYLDESNKKLIIKVIKLL